MIRIIKFNRVPAFRRDGQPYVLDGEQALSEVNCEVQIVLDRHVNKAHFDLTGREAKLFDDFASIIEDRIAQQITEPPAVPTGQQSELEDDTNLAASANAR
jgi:hypothetical protein